MTTESDDRDLIERAGMLGVPGGTPLAMKALSQLIVNLKNEMTSQSAAATQLSKRIERLTFWLLLFTIAIFVLTGVLAWTTLRGVAR